MSYSMIEHYILRFRHKNTEGVDRWYDSFEEAEKEAKAIVRNKLSNEVIIYKAMAVCINKPNDLLLTVYP